MKGEPGVMLRIIGHRGARALLPENTLRAVARGLDCVGWVEVDVRLSREGVPVVIHDATLDRTTDGKGAVRDTPLAELRRRDAGMDERIPLLSEVLDLVGHRGGIVIEAKEVETVPAICSLLQTYGTRDVLLVSFHAEAVSAARSRLPDLDTGLIVSRKAEDPLVMAARAGVRTVLPRQDLLTEELVRRARGHAINVYTWTLNTEAEVLRAVRLGVDGFATDDPCSAREWVGYRFSMNRGIAAFQRAIEGSRRTREDDRSEDRHPDT